MEAPRSLGMKRRRLGTAGLAAVLGVAIISGLAIVCGAALAQETRFFRIGTGATSGTYYSVGSMIASTISNPPGSWPCERGGSCGVPGLIAVAQSTSGSFENVEAVAAGQLESALAQADVVYWAYHGTGPFRDKGALGKLRAVANLFSSTVHVVVRANSSLFSMEDLRGHRVSLGEVGSGTHVVAETVLDAYGFAEGDIKPFHHKPGPASDLLHDGELDAFFVAGGPPVPAVADLAARMPIRLLPISGTTGEELKTFNPFFSDAAIQSGVYPNVGHTLSVGVSTQWVVSAETDADFVFALTQALWHEQSQALFQKGPPEGRTMGLERALQRIAIPLHPGAERYYAEQGMHR